MTERSKPLSGAARAGDRKERLARALRDNLKRRKAQARERQAVPAADMGKPPSGGKG